MTETEIWSGLTTTFRELFEDDSLTISADTTATDIEEWDSLRHIELLVAVEQEFGVRFNTGEVAGLKNVGEMVQLIAAKKGAVGS
jgi:acyl carrier protein